MAADQIWIRCGDQDEYHSFSNMDAAADYLIGMGVTDTLMYHNKMGVSCHDYNGPHNYISLYWGGKNAEDVERGFKEEELVLLNNAIEGQIDSKPKTFSKPQTVDEAGFDYDDVQADNDW